MRTQRSSLIDPLKKAKEHDAETAQSYKDSLDGLLWRMEGGGSFAASGAYSKAPLPDLFLQGFGPVPLPLAQRDAEAICKERTAEDTGRVPRVEKSVDGDSGKPRFNQWNMEAECLNIRNPGWDKFIQGVASKAAEDLGIKSNAKAARAKIHKAHLWAVGAYLPPRKKIQKVPGGFGKLLICLPAAHEGGSLSTRYRGVVKEFKTETSCRWSYSYVAWYTDVTLEFKPLGLGYRFMLEYDLVLPALGQLPSLAQLYSGKDKILNILAMWNGCVEKEYMTEMCNFPTLLAYNCDDHYTNHPLSLNALQGKDRLRAACLEELGSQISMGVYIANLERTHTGTCDYDRYNHHSIDNEEDDSIILEKVVDFRGKTITCGIVIENDNFIESEPFDYEPDEEDFDSQYRHMAHIYRRTVLILIPSIAKEEWLPQESKEDRSKKRKRDVEVIDLEQTPRN